MVDVPISKSFFAAAALARLVEAAYGLVSVKCHVNREPKFDMVNA